MFDARGSFCKIMQKLGLAGDTSLSKLKDCFETKVMVVDLTSCQLVLSKSKLTRIPD